MLSSRDRKKYNEYQREYQRKYQREKYQRFRAEILQRLGGQCVVCQSTENLYVDHIVASSKKYEVKVLYSRRKEVRETELAKCQLLCQRCHEFKTQVLRENLHTHSKFDGIHGSGYMYTQKKCRCDLCKKWRVLYRKSQIGYSESVSN